MSQRLLDTTKCLCYLLVLLWSPARGVQVAVGGARPPPKVPASIEAQAKFFQYRNFPTHEDFDQGHRLGSERHFTERHEKARPSEGLFSAKVRWGDKKGGYGEHYWDLNHAGHANDHGDGDDGHYNHHADDEPYHHDDDNSNHGYGSNDNSPIFGNDEYDPEKSSYEENGRAKRAHPKIKTEKRYQTEETDDDEPIAPKLKKRKNKEHPTEPPPRKVEKYSDEDEDEEIEEEIYKKPKRQHHRQSEEEEEEEPKPKEAKNQVVLVVKEKDRSKQQQAEQEQTLQSAYPNNQAYTQYVPYEGGAGVRQHHQPEVAAAASVPRLFLEPSTGHIVDSATGQAYVLQPIAVNNNYN